MDLGLLASDTADGSGEGGVYSVVVFAFLIRVSSVLLSYSYGGGIVIKGFYSGKNKDNTDGPGLMDK